MIREGGGENYMNMYLKSTEYNLNPEIAKANAEHWARYNEPNSVITGIYGERDKYVD